MNRYIDADAALKRFEEIHGNESELLNCYNADWVVSFIETQPTADVREDRRGVWCVCGRFEDFLCCPFCGYTVPQERVIDERIAYCGRCGANLRRIYHE